jgi:hypothetical protein
MWVPKSRLRIVQHLCLRTIGTAYPSQPQLLLVLARGNDGVVRHLSAYQVLGRTVGVEWARGVPTWSNRSPGLHVLQELDDEGMPVCPAVFEALPVDARGRVNDTRGSRDSVVRGDTGGGRMILLHRGRPLLVNDRGRVFLGRHIAKSLTKRGGKRERLHRPKYRQHCYQGFLSDGDGGGGRHSRGSLEPAWMHTIHVPFDPPERALLFSFPPPVALTRLGLTQLGRGKGEAAAASGADVEADGDADADECGSSDDNGKASSERESCVDEDDGVVLDNVENGIGMNIDHAGGDFASSIGERPMVVADGALSWYLNGCTEYHFFRRSLREWMERTISNSDDTDPDRSWRWPVEYLADAVIDLYPELNSPGVRDATIRAAERVMFREFWCAIVHGLRPPAHMCARLSQNIGMARLRDDLVGDSVAGNCGAAQELSRLRVVGSPSWNIRVLGRVFECLTNARHNDEERSADFFLPAMMAAVALSAVPAEILLAVREVLRSVYALGRRGYTATTFYCAVEALLQLGEYGGGSGVGSGGGLPEYTAADDVSGGRDVKQPDVGRRRERKKYQDQDQDQDGGLTSNGERGPVTSPLRRKQVGQGEQVEQVSRSPVDCI